MGSPRENRREGRGKGGRGRKEEGKGGEKGAEGVLEFPNPELAARSWSRPVAVG